MGGTELKADSRGRWMLYTKDVYGNGRIFLTTEQKQAAQEGSAYSQWAYADVWARDAELVKRVRSFLGANFYWHTRLVKNGSDVDVIQTLQSMIRGKSVELIAEQSRSAAASASPLPTPERLPSFREQLMTQLGMSYDAASDYIDWYNAMVDNVRAVAARYASRAASSLAGEAGALTKAAATPLASALPFEYTSDAVSGEVEELAGGEGTPGNNQAQNKQFKAVIKALGLDRGQARQLHDEISGEGLGYHEMMERAQDMFAE